MDGNPDAPRPASVDPRILRVVHALVPRLVTQGARAVVLVGSHARADAHPESDVDVYALGRGPESRLLRREGLLLSVSWRTPEQVREEFVRLPNVGGVVPGWRRLVPVHDPAGIAAALYAEACAWTWDAVGEERCDRYVAEWLTGLAEEVHKLVVSLELDRSWTAAAQRSVLALQLARLLALHRRMLYETENRLWDLVAERLGPRWARAQGAAFGDGGQSFEESCAAALELYALAAAEVRHLLDEVQLDVVAHACALAGHPLTSD